MTDRHTLQGNVNTLQVVACKNRKCSIFEAVTIHKVINLFGEWLAEHVRKQAREKLHLSVVRKLVYYAGR